MRVLRRERRHAGLPHHRFSVQIGDRAGPVTGEGRFLDKLDRLAPEFQPLAGARALGIRAEITQFADQTADLIPRFGGERPCDSARCDRGDQKPDDHFPGQFFESKQ
jgi:hypothetical protein